MNVLDILILVPLAYAAYKGFKHGFILELFTLLAIVVGIYVGIHFSDYAANFLQTNFNWTSEYLPVASFTVTFLAVGALIFFAGKVLEKMIKVVQLSPLNKAAGVLFATIKCLYIISSFLVLLESYDEKNAFLPAESKEKALLYVPVRDLSLKTIPALSESTIFLRNKFKPMADSTQLTVDEVIRAKEIADSLGIDAHDAETVIKVHNKYAH